MDDWSEYIPTAIKLPIKLYKHRILIQGWWVQLLAKIDRGDTDIAILGVSGSGKTYLSKFLHGQAPKFSFKAGLSEEVETEAIQFGQWTKLVRVIPGQESKDRSLGLDEVFKTSQNLEGIIYVVDFGFSEVRNDTVKQIMISDQNIDSIEKIREFNLNNELEDLKLITNKIKERNALGNGIKWFIIAVNKIDLYYENINEAQKYYSKEYNTPFTIIINDMITNIGSSNIKVETLPISSWQKDFEWNGNTVGTNLGGKEIEYALGAKFIETIAEKSK